MPDQAFAIHGLSDEFLSDKPIFSEIADDFLDFIGSAKLVIHNAAFDIKFINAELKNIELEEITFDRATDTLALARKKFPGSPASLDSLCRRFKIDNSARIVHGALLDSQILAEVYLELVGGKQPDFALNVINTASENNDFILNDKRLGIRKEILKPRLTKDEKDNHKNFIKKLGNDSMWLKIFNS